MELLQDEVLYATEEVERLTKVLDEQNGLLQSFQEQTTQKDSTIQSLQQQVCYQIFITERRLVLSNKVFSSSTFYSNQVKKQEEAAVKETPKRGFNLNLGGAFTPKSLPQVKDSSFG